MTTMTRLAISVVRSLATRLIAAGFGAVRTHFCARTDDRRLRNFTDRMLTDVGLTRGDLGRPLGCDGMSPTLFY